MSIELRDQEVAPGVVVVTIAGKLVMPAINDQIATLVDSLLHEGARTIVFDLAGITTLDSTGVGQFISSFNKIGAAGGEMRMAAATGHVMTTFHISRLNTVFKFYPTVEAATAG